jgi:hypothetical protein
VIKVISEGIEGRNGTEIDATIAGALKRIKIERLLGMTLRSETAVS